MNTVYNILIGTFLGLLFSRIFSKKDDTLKKQEAIAAHIPTGVEEMSGINVGTPLDKEHVRKAIIFNGFVPYEAGDGWFAFKVQGETYCCSYGNGPLMQFYKGYKLDMDDVDYHHELCIKASETVLHESLMGRVTFDDEEVASGIEFRVTGIEMTYEHLCISFMEYIHMLESLSEHHAHEYYQLVESLKANVIPSYTEMPKESKVLS